MGMGMRVLKAENTILIGEETTMTEGMNVHYDDRRGRWISLSSMGGIHISGLTRWIITSMLMRFLGMRGCQ